MSNDKSFKESNSSLIRWAPKHEDYDIEYRRSNIHTNLDSISTVEVHKKEIRPHTEQEQYMKAFNEQFTVERQENDTNTKENPQIDCLSEENDDDDTVTHPRHVTKIPSFKFE